MDEVCKARDTRLDRVIAVKLSAERFDERFEREARAVVDPNYVLITRGARKVHLCPISMDIGASFCQNWPYGCHRQHPSRDRYGCV